MVYLSISILFLLLSIVIFLLFKKQSTRITDSARRVSGDGWLKSTNWNKNEIQLYERLSSLKKKQRIILIVYLSLSLIFFILYIRLGHSSKNIHSMHVSYEGFGVFTLGKTLTTHFSNSSPEMIIETMVITPNSENPYISGIIAELYKGLDPDLFKIISEYSIDAQEFRLSNYELVSSHLQELLFDNPETELVISLAGFLQDDGYEWAKNDRPYIAVFSEKAELNGYVNSINQGVVDIALISKGSYESHTLIPRDTKLETIFENNYLLVNSTNIPQIVKNYKQIISLVSDKSLGSFD